MALQINRILDDVANEVVHAKLKFPMWSDDPFHALAVISEEVGELNKAVVQHTYEPDKGVDLDDIRQEAIQVAAMAIRFVMSLDDDEYWFEKSDQHRQ